MEKKIITAREIFHDARSAFNSDKKFICRTALTGFFLPMTALSFMLDLAGISAAQGVRDSFFNVSPQVKEFSSYLGQVLPYFSLVMLASVVFYIIIIGCYCALTARVSARARGLPEDKTLPEALKKTLPTALAFLLMLALTSILAQVAMFPAIFLMCVGTMFPVLQFAEGRGAFKALWHSITIRYCRSRNVSGWNVFFNLISIGAFCYTGFVLFAFVGETLLVADTYVAMPRSLWYWQIPGTEIGLIYALVSTIESLIFSTVLVALCLLTNALYYKLRQPAAVLAVA